MGSATHQRLFEVSHEDHDDPPEHSLDREPWRAFRPSLAVEFTSSRSGGWSADKLSEEAKAEIISGLAARSSIISSYSRIQSTVRDFVARNGFKAPPEKRFRVYGAGNKDALDYARSLTSDGGQFPGRGQELSMLFDRIEATAGAVDLIVRGFVEVREEKCGAIVFRFQQWRRRQRVTSNDLKTQAVALKFVSGEAASRLATAMELS